MQEEGVQNPDSELQIWNYALGFTNAAVVKCAIELGIADSLEAHSTPMTLSNLSSSLGCVPSFLFRIMRFLVHHRVFGEDVVLVDGEKVKAYTLTPASRCLLKKGDQSMAAYILLKTDPGMLLPWHFLGARVREAGKPAFELAHGQNFWSYASQDPALIQLFNGAMACLGRAAVRTILKSCPEVFDGVAEVVDVGGGNGTAMSVLVEARPSITAVTFDLPHVVAAAPPIKGVDFVGGDMFDKVPQADAAFLMKVLHDWGDEECIQILKKCIEAVPKEKGKVIIVDVVFLEDDDKYGNFSDVALMVDMAMMAHTNNGKERTEAEWKELLTGAGFSRYTVTRIPAAESVIEAYP